jgi:hypothetical protein
VRAAFFLKGNAGAETRQQRARLTVYKVSQSGELRDPYP